MFLAPVTAFAGEALLAVAANFGEAAERLAGDFAARAAHRVTLATGSTGKLYAQIRNGAPYDALLAADAERPALLEASGHGVAGTRFVYASGLLTLWSPDPRRIGGDGRAVLARSEFAALAIANPALAPYGAAAREALQSIGLWSALESRVVMGENIGQTHALVATGNAELGFVALSQVLSPRNRRPGSRWDVPPALYAPIHQEAVLLAHGADNDAARAFLSYLRTEDARALIAGFGYAVD